VKVQNGYWQELADLKRDAYYIDLCHERTEKINRVIDGFTAITSSAAIGAWVVWKDLSWIWGLLIAFSQVLHAIKEYMPYKKRLRALSSLSHDLHALSIIAETDWFKVSQGLLEEDEIHRLHMKLKKKKHETVYKSFPSTSLPISNKILARADQDTQNYLQTYYGQNND
jgi:hypothetical protein